jgi:hypothetical protein
VKKERPKEAKAVNRWVLRREIGRKVRHYLGKTQQRENEEVNHEYENLM